MRQPPNLSLRLSTGERSEPANTEARKRRGLTASAKQRGPTAGCEGAAAYRHFVADRIVSVYRATPSRPVTRSSTPTTSTFFPR